MTETLEEQEQAENGAVPDGQDPDAGKLFEVPRVAVLIDETDPNVLKLAFSGSIELDRASAADVEFFNGLRAGQNYPLAVEG